MAGVAVGPLSRVCRDASGHEAPGEVLEHRAQPSPRAFAVGVLTGCGFTVSLLIAELAFDAGTPGTRGLVASLLAALFLRRRVRASAGSAGEPA